MPCGRVDGGRRNSLKYPHMKFLYFLWLVGTSLSAMAGYMQVGDAGDLWQRPPAPSTNAADIARAASEQELLAPVIASLKAMREDYSKISPEAREREIDIARVRIRQGWLQGVRGYEATSMLLTLDIIRRDEITLLRDAVMILDADPDDPAANAVGGSIMLAKGNVVEAERHLVKAVKGGGPMAMCDYARVLVMRGEFDAAETWARKAVNLRSEDASMREPLIAALVESRRLDEAERELATMISLAQGSSRAQTMRFAGEVSKRIASFRSSHK